MIMEAAGGGGAVSGPIAKKVMEAYFENKETEAGKNETQTAP